MAENINMFGYVLVSFTILMILKIYFDSDWHNLTCIISTVDGNKYCVREKENMDQVADILAITTQRLKNLVKYAGEKYPDRDNIKRLVNNFNPRKVKEILPTSSYTAYSENKGEKLAFCTTKTKKGKEIIDEDTIFFVGMHELAHIMTVSIGHKPEFWDNFRFLLTIAKESGTYTPVDYKKSPVTYCGMKITDNPYFDL